MPIKIKSTNDVHVNGIKAVVFGPAGAGKTVLCSTAPKPIIISAEQGLLSLAGKDIPYIEVTNVQDIADSYKFLIENDDYNTICIDSLSEIADVLVDEFKKEVKDVRQAYGKLADALMPMIRKFRDIKGKNVVFTAKAKRIEDEHSGSNTMEPLMPGQVLPLNIPYLVDELLYMEVDRKGNRMLRCKPKLGILAKDRSGVLNDLEAPNLTEIFDKIINTKPIPF